MSLGRTLRTIRHLKPVQIGNRAWRWIRRPRPRLGSPPPLRDFGQLGVDCGRPESLLADEHVKLLGVTRRLNTAGDWNHPAWPKLWLYTLHYHDGLRAETTDAELKRAFVGRWIAENPPVLGNGWEPYPLSRRIVNWIFWLLQGQQPEPKILASLATQVRALENQIEFHLLGNHLWANAKALVFAGLFFRGPEADRWLSKGLRLAESERREQFLADGGHFELSPTYHQLMVEDLLDLLNVAAAAGRPLPIDWPVTVERTLQWVTVMTRPDGSVPLLNDASEGMAPSTQALSEYAARLGIVDPPPARPGLTTLLASGYARWSGHGFTAWVDVGRIGPDHIPGHGHADCLGFELFGDGRPLIVDTGVSTYDRGPRRLHERGTRAHNTVTVGDADQAELWASFRVGRRPSVLGITVAADAIAAEHNGYDRLGARHRRTFEFADRALTVRDEVRRTRPGPVATARFHLAPSERVERHGDQVTVGPLRFCFSDGSALRVEECQIARGFGDLRPAQCLAVDFNETLVTRIALASPATS